MKRLIAIVGGGIAAALAVLALLLGWLQTGPGKAWLADAVGAALSDASRNVDGERHHAASCRSIFHVGEIVIADEDGPRLRVERRRDRHSARAIFWPAG